MSTPTTPGKTRHGVRFHNGPDNMNATPIRAGNNFRSSTKIGETQQEIRASLWGRVLFDDPHLVNNLIKPHLVDNALVTTIATSINQSEGLKAAYEILVDNKVKEAAMYDPMLQILRHISTFDPKATSTEAPAPNSPGLSAGSQALGAPAATSSTASPTSTTIIVSGCASSPAVPVVASSHIIATATPEDDSGSLHFTSHRKSYGTYVNRAWVDTHAVLLRTDPGLFVSVRGIRDHDEEEKKRPILDDSRTRRSKVARTSSREDAATASRTQSLVEGSELQHEDSSTIKSPPGPTNVEPGSGSLLPAATIATLVEDDDNDKSGTPKEAVMEDRKPDISLIDLPESGQIPLNYLWRQCAVFMEIKKHAAHGPIGDDTDRASLAEGSIEFETTESFKGGYSYRSIVTQMADNARLVMATRPFLRYTIHIAFCGTNFNIVFIDRDGVVLSRSYHIQVHLDLFIRIIRRLACEMTAYDLGLDTTVHPEGCLGSSTHFPSILVKVAPGVWYRTEGVPIWQPTTLLGRGTLVFDARESNQPNGPLRILKNSWREDGRIREAELYKLIQEPSSKYDPVDTLAKFLEGGDILLQDGNNVTLASHRDQLGAWITGKGATLHRLVLATRGKSLACYETLEDLLEAAIDIVIGHKTLFELGILHGDISMGNVFMSTGEDPDTPSGFLADLDLVTLLAAKVKEYFGEDGERLLKEQGEKGHRSGTVIFMCLELLRLSRRYHVNVEAAHKQGKDGARTLSVKREPHHDLEAFLWVLVYAMMIHYYNSLTNEDDRKKYRGYIDEFFGHGSFTPLFRAREDLISAPKRVSEDRVAEWFPDENERKLFIEMMELIDKHNTVIRATKQREPVDLALLTQKNRNMFKRRGIGKQRTDAESEDEAIVDKDQSGMYHEAGAPPLRNPPPRVPVITYESVIALLTGNLSEL